MGKPASPQQIAHIVALARDLDADLAGLDRWLVANIGAPLALTDRATASGLILIFRRWLDDRARYL